MRMQVASMQVIMQVASMQVIMQVASMQVIMQVASMQVKRTKDVVCGPITTLIKILIQNHCS